MKGVFAKRLVVLMFSGLVHLAMAQGPCTLTLSGTITDDHTNEPLAGATIGVAGRPGIITAN
ncbi:MAG TPA: hypothetical protein PKD90_17495, partial [Phnomibacter sp.]|nr:hypothetical protein [Phnomibacter sp.]